MVDNAKNRAPISTVAFVVMIGWVALGATGTSRWKVGIGLVVAVGVFFGGMWLYDTPAPDDSWPPDDRSDT
ncbi:hypothetical protein ABLE94_19910 [Gordonia sp. VNK1]|uniref:hypothetical protein n=1 Tax=Gordonia oleivorans TaxID=3156618 RepID=UPI0032B42F72